MSLILGFVCLGFMFLWIKEREKVDILKYDLRIEKEHGERIEKLLRQKMAELGQI